MERDNLTTIAEVVLKQLYDKRTAAVEADILVTLPIYLDATDIHFLQMEVNWWSSISIELQHRPGERRVGVRLLRAKSLQLSH
jgi:hypothetical protein